MLLRYAREGCPVDMGRNWTKERILEVSHRGPHTSVLELDTIKMMHKEVEDKVKEGFAEIVNLADIEHLFGTRECAQLKNIATCHGRSQESKFRAILDISFKLQVLGI